MTNLQDQNPPDFMSDAYKDAREALKAHLPDVTDAIAANSLKAMWEAKNAADAREQQQQQALQEAAAVEQARLQKVAEEEAIAAEREEREAARREEEKKNKAKYIPVAVGQGLPNEIPIEVPPTVFSQIGSRQDRWAVAFHG
jgi:midasin (ATPase involved in ribosome maturation)